MKSIKLLLLFIFLSFLSLKAQLKNFDLSEDFQKLEIPFEFENNFIVMKVFFNDNLPLHFIFDTGAEHTILTKREISDILRLKYKRRFSILGADMTTQLTAFLIQGIRLDIGELTTLNHSILVLAEDYFNFEELAGIDVQGIIGADIMNRFVVEIDYQKQIITFYDPRYYTKPKKNFTEIPLKIKKHKPYLTVDVTFQKDKKPKAMKLLLDTGAGLSMLMSTNSIDSLDLPQKMIKTRIGTGLGGYLEGFYGRLDKVDLKGYHLNGVLTSFQYLPPRIDSMIREDRNGILGNELLSRFRVTIDYINEVLYLEPNRKFKQKFVYDRSGVVLVAGGTHRLNAFIVTYVIPNSPAAEAGIKKGDRIKSINRLPASFYSLSDIYRKFKKRPGKKIRFAVIRNGEKLVFNFRLRVLI